MKHHSSQTELEEHKTINKRTNAADMSSVSRQLTVKEWEYPSQLSDGDHCVHTIRLIFITYEFTTLVNTARVKQIRKITMSRQSLRVTQPNKSLVMHEEAIAAR